MQKAGRDSSSRKPLLVVADDDPAARVRLENELVRRYGADYAVRGCATEEMTVTLDRARLGDDVAIVSARASGAELLASSAPASRRHGGRC